MNSSRLVLTILLLFSIILTVFFFSGILNLFQITLLLYLVSIAVTVNLLDSLLPEKELQSLLLDRYLIEWGGAIPFKMIVIVTTRGIFKTTFFSGNFPVLVNKITSVKRKTKINITYSPILRRILFVEPSGTSWANQQVMRGNSKMVSKEFIEKLKESHKKYFFWNGFWSVLVIILFIPVLYLTNYFPPEWRLKIFIPGATVIVIAVAVIWYKLTDVWVK